MIPARGAAARSFALALVGGAVAALGLAPYDLWPAAIGGFAALALWVSGAGDARQAAWRGWAFGAGYFGHALIWIVEPFFVDAARHGWMAPFALAGMAGGLAMFWAAASGAAYALGAAADVRHAQAMRGVALIGCLALAEVARAHVLTGFPWAAPAQIWANHGAILALAWIGPQGLMLLTLAAAILPVCLSGAARIVALLPVVALAAGGIVQRAVPPSEATQTVVRIVQPNAAQHLKWDPQHMWGFFDRQVGYTASAPPPDLIVWPETAVPTLLEWADEALATIAGAAGGVPVAVGIQRRDADGRFYNSLTVVDPAAARPGPVYDKHHLVPFGEYMPLQGLADRIGLTALAARMGGYAAGPGPRILSFGAAGRGLVMICYEAVFPGHARLRGGDASGRPDFLIQVTNDAWFGGFSGPYQHLAQARMRAVEQGLPMIRSANTGVSAMIDPMGRISAEIALGAAGYVDAALPAAAGATLYARTGDRPAVLLIFAMVAALGFARMRARRSN